MFILGLLTVMLFFFTACKSSPAVDTPPPTLVFNDIEAENPEKLSLYFSLELENPFPVDISAVIDSWQVEINDRRAPLGFSLEHPALLEISGSLSVPLRLDMDIAALARAGLAPADDYRVNLILSLELSGNSRAPVPSGKLEVSSLAEFPGVRAPEFTITSIAILKAELVNTGFRLGLRIVNPNPYSVNLSALSYVLYGNGRRWADGLERKIGSVPGKSALQGHLVLGMNFIDMGRDLFDQIVNLVDVNYRFAGNAIVTTGVDYLPSFDSGFDLSGYSIVLPD